MIKKMLAVCVCSVALAAAPLTAFAVEEIDIDEIEVIDDDETDLLTEPTSTPTIFPEEEFPDSSSEPGDNISDGEPVEEEPVEEPVVEEPVEEEPVEDELAEEYDYSVLYYDYENYGPNNEIMLLADYNTYYGSISSTYLEYMRGYLSKIGIDEHYVGARTGQNQYIFAYGNDLNFDGEFFGSDITVITWNTANNGNFTIDSQSDFNLNPGSNMVYSDLSTIYPSLSVSSDLSLRQILYLLVIAFLIMFMNKMYQVNKIRRIKGMM